MKRNYDTIAWFYDRLARLIFGTTLVNAQLFLIRAIPPMSRILIVGGGTGWILEEIAKLHQSGLTITYIDASEKMIGLAQQRNTGNNQIEFISTPIEAVSLAQAYDIVLTPFLFDNFSQDSLSKMFDQLSGVMKPRGLWLYADFQATGIAWQRLVLKIMYMFFRVSCGIEATHLPDAKSLFTEHNFTNQTQRSFMNQFIIAVVYQKA